MYQAVQQLFSWTGYILAHTMVTLSPEYSTAAATAILDQLPAVLPPRLFMPTSVPPSLALHNALLAATAASSSLSAGGPPSSSTPSTPGGAGRGRASLAPSTLSSLSNPARPVTAPGSRMFGLGGHPTVLRLPDTPPPATSSAKPAVKRPRADTSPPVVVKQEKTSSNLPVRSYLFAHLLILNFSSSRSLSVNA